MSAGMVDATARRKWDKDEYARRAEERARREEEETEAARSGIRKPHSTEARPNLQAREKQVDLKGKLGKSRVVESMRSRDAGYYCEVCDCLLKDSMNYLDHINGIQHQKAMGMSMRVERSTVEQVRQKIEEMKQRRDEAKQKKKIVFSLEDRVARMQALEEKRRQQRRERKRRKRVEARTHKRPKAQDDPEAEGAIGQVEMEQDEDVMAMMGFGGFGTTAQS
eukprot:m.124796 g.124796  ORF g.124796 m.124796 type:complete len:222 (-) comp13785_c0_seq1:1663-2328(-)